MLSGNIHHTRHSPRLNKIWKNLATACMLLPHPSTHIHFEIRVSTAYRSSYGPPMWNSSERACSTRMKSRWLRTDSWCTPTFMPNSSLYWPLICTTPGIEYMPWMTHTFYLLTPRLLKPYHRTFCGTWTKAFSSSTKVKWNSLLGRCTSVAGEQWRWRQWYLYQAQHWRC